MNPDELREAELILNEVEQLHGWLDSASGNFVERLRYIVRSFEADHEADALDLAAYDAETRALKREMAKLRRRFDALLLRTKYDR